MPTVPVRGVGAVGVITDLSPQDLPDKAWTDAKNVRFSEGTISRYSVFKKINNSYVYTKTPIGLLDGGGSSGDGYLVTVFSDGTMQELFNGVATNVTPTGVLNTSLLQVTNCNLGDVTYVNRYSDVPIYRHSPGDGAFAPIPGWSSNDRCKALRSFKDYLIGISVNKSTTAYPGMVKWSDAAQVAAPPSNWDVTLSSSLAGETILNDLRGSLVDGLPLADVFIVYGEEQTYRMEYIGEPFIFRFTKVFDDQGMMSQNCAVAVDAKHFVFGNSDIFVHDGMTRASICDGFVRDKVFSEIDFNLRSRCFTYHDRHYSEIGFCYPSIGSDSAWSSSVNQGCNKAAVFNYKFNTWTFVDLPNLTAACESSQTTVTTWADVPTWDAFDSTWNSFEGRRPKSLIVASCGDTVSSKSGMPYFVDELGEGRLSNAVDMDIAWPAFAEVTYMDLDSLGVEIQGRKLLRKIVPQFRTLDPDHQIKMTVGQSRNLNTSVTWGPQLSMNPWNDDKYDTRINGQYLAIRLDIPVGVPVTFSGYDAELIPISGR